MVSKIINQNVDTWILDMNSVHEFNISVGNTYLLFFVFLLVVVIFLLCISASKNFAKLSTHLMFVCLKKKGDKFNKQKTMRAGWTHAWILIIFLLHFLQQSKRQHRENVDVDVCNHVNSCPPLLIMIL